MIALPVPERALSEPVARIAGLMAGFSIEATRPTSADIAALGVLKRGTRVYLSALPGRPVEETITAAAGVRTAGLEPVPHVAVRNFSTEKALDDFLARLNGNADVRSVLVIAGDRNECGPFRSTRDAIDSGILRRRGIRSVGIAGYPEGHPKISDEELKKALAAKIAAAEAIGVAVEIVTQFCFDPNAILSFIRQLRSFGFEHRVRVGLVGPTSLTALMRYAARCGVRASAQGLARRAGLVRQVFALTTPDDLIRTLADAAPADVVPHFFSFGGLGATGRWTAAVAEGCVTLDSNGGFRVNPPGNGG
jgi:methylenetetrahydrofolate reductase (NADPH)